MEFERNEAKDLFKETHASLEKVQRQERELRAELVDKAELAERLTRDLTKAEAARQELQEQQIEMNERLKMTEYQLI